MQSVIHTANTLMAEAFIHQLEPTGVVTFQTIDDNKLRRNRSLSRIFHGTLKQHISELTQLQQQGAGVFVMVNKGDGKGRSAANVLSVRAHVLDLDGAPLAPVMESALPPHIVVESSPNKWHAYWLVEDCPLHEFKARQHALATRFNGDMAVCDLPRVMRVPGFWHQKGTPFQTRLVKPAFEG